MEIHRWYSICAVFHLLYLTFLAEVPFLKAVFCPENFGGSDDSVATYFLFCLQDAVSSFFAFNRLEIFSCNKLGFVSVIADFYPLAICG